MILQLCNYPKVERLDQWRSSIDRARCRSFFPRKARLISLISFNGLGANYERVGVIRRHNPRNRKVPGGHA